MTLRGCSSLDGRRDFKYRIRLGAARVLGDDNGMKALTCRLVDVEVAILSSGGCLHTGAPAPGCPHQEQVELIEYTPCRSLLHMPVRIKSVAV